MYPSRFRIRCLAFTAWVTVRPDGMIIAASPYFCAFLGQQFDALLQKLEEQVWKEIVEIEYN